MRSATWGGAVSRQLIGVLAALLVSTFLVFSAMYLVPGDPLTFLSGGREMSPEVREAYAAQFQLDRPFLERYASWLGGVAQGDFGDSLISRAPIMDLVAPRVGTTLLLMVMSTCIMLVIGIGAGVVGGLGSRRVGSAVSTASALGLAIPPFVAAALLTAVFAVGLHWFPVIGSGDGFLDQVYHLVLPSLALALSGCAYIARITRVAVRSEAASEHVETAWSRGLPSNVVVRRHILRNAMLPVSTVVGLMVAGLLAGTVVVESAFGLNGLGSLLVQSVLNKDFAVVQAVALLLIVTFIVINLVVDLCYLLIDPRTRERAVR